MIFILHGSLDFPVQPSRDFIIVVNVPNAVRASTVEQVFTNYDKGAANEYYSYKDKESVRYIVIGKIRSKEDISGFIPRLP